MNRWKRMQPVRVTADVQSLARASGGRIDEIWTNDEYEAMVFYLGSEGRRGRVHLSIKRMDRGHVHDWRHLQTIKNEILGPEREAVELYPAESRLADGANQMHLWAAPSGECFDFGYLDRNVQTEAQAKRALELLGLPTEKLRQRPWQPGLNTGPR